MTMDELRGVSVQDILDSAEYRKRLNAVLNRRAVPKDELRMMRRLRDCRLTDADVFIPILCDVINKTSNLPTQVRAYVRYIGWGVFRELLAELKAKAEANEEGKV